MLESLNSPVVEVEVGHFEFWRSRNVLWVFWISRDGKAVVLGGNEYASRLEVLDRVISAAMPIGQLFCRPAEAERDELVAQTDAEDGHLALGDGSNGLRRIRDCRRVAWPVREEDAVGLEFQRL